MAVKIRYCGHDAWFIADVIHVAGAVVIKGNGPIEQHLNRPGDGATHQLTDFPGPVYWNPRLGVFVVPKKQFTEIRVNARKEK